MDVDTGGFTRGQFLKVAAGTAAGLLCQRAAPADATGLSVPGPAHLRRAPAALFHSYRSRPDLHPPIATVRPGGIRSLNNNDRLWFLSVLKNEFLTEAQSGLLILDGQGEPVWARVLPTSWFAMNFRVQTYRGQPVLTWFEGTLVGGGQGVILDSSYREIARVQAGNGLQLEVHEFLLTPEGTALITVVPPAVPADLTSVGGSRHGRVAESVIQEVDVETGEVLLEWRSLEHVPVSESYMWAGNGPYDYMHLNSIDVTPDGNLLVSGRHTWALYKLERQTGRVMWRLGGKRSDFHMGKGAQFAWQHDGRQVDERTITVFDDGAAFFEGNHRFRTAHRQSRGLALSVDHAAGRVTVGRSYRRRPSVLAGGYGNVQTLPNEDVVIGWGNLSEFSQFTADGVMVAELDLPVMCSSYRAFRHPWRGTPGEPPALAVTRGRRGHGVTVQVSWNGSTECSGWRIRAGADRSRLHTVAHHGRMGFETTIDVAVTSGYVEAVALDSSGRALARSDIVKL